MAKHDTPRPEGACNARPRDETIAETGRGLPDEAAGQDELQPGELTADPKLVQRVRKDLGVQGAREEE